MRRDHLAALGLLLFALALWAGGMAVALRDARLPDTASGRVLAVFGPLSSPEENFAALIAAGASPVRRVSPFVWVAHDEAPGLAGRLRAQGARLVTGEFAFGPALTGCLAYVGER